MVRAAGHADQDCLGEDEGAEAADGGEGVAGGGGGGVQERVFDHELADGDGEHERGGKGGAAGAALRPEGGDFVQFAERVEEGEGEFEEGVLGEEAGAGGRVVGGGAGAG